MKNLEVTTFPSRADLPLSCVPTPRHLPDSVGVDDLDAVRGSGQLGRRLRAVISLRSFTTVRPHPRSLYFDPAHRLGIHSDTSDEANFEREVQMIARGPESSYKIHAPESHLWVVIQSPARNINSGEAHGRPDELVRGLHSDLGLLRVSVVGRMRLLRFIQYDPSHDYTPTPEGATDNSWMTPEDRVKGPGRAGGIRGRHGGVLLVCLRLCRRDLGRGQGARLLELPRDYYLHSLTHVLCLCYCCTCLFICTFRELPEEEPGSSYEAPAAPAAPVASPTRRRSF